MTRLHVPVEEPPSECQSCWRPWVWRVTFTPPKTRLGPPLATKHRYCCSRHFYEACWHLQPNQARHRELTVTHSSDVTSSSPRTDERVLSPQEARPRGVPMGVRMPSASRTRRASQTPRDLGARGK